MWITLEGDFNWISRYLLDSDTVDVYYCAAPATVTVPVTAHAEIFNWYYDPAITTAKYIDNLQKNQDGYYVGEFTFTGPGTFLINDGCTAWFGSFFIVIE